ncbi:CsiV family protein [Neptuniibacter sp. 1_MG-2023]|uniref:CsiV family protein n=1 Tax=Neptuniibacter sp. 1_MG-2023 TaxID=3062662 RepID=UPI0026E2D154|nr:CsiV family protein [Neptuniibacter sp. 1_MG-2023]MDO6594926.1 CsiV family protein [Neptuniibacter sp. 1_MG-2023]
MKKLYSALIFSALSLTANAADWYKVEVVVFANQDSAPIADEYWPDIEEIPAPSNAINLKSSNAEGSAYKRLPGSSLTLHDEKNRLRNSGPYKVLFHAGWMQPVYRTQTPRPIHITGGEILDNGMHELDGYIAVGRGTYLHFRPDLYLSRRLSADEAKLLKDDPTATNNAVDENAASILTMQASSSASSSLASELFTIPNILTANLNQARRMKSKELHYIDHPLMGILVEIRPVN